MGGELGIMEGVAGTGLCGSLHAPAVPGRGE